MAKGKIVKPTAAEKVAIIIRLKKKYPQMYQPGWWGKKKPKKSKSLDTTRTKAISARLREAGVSQKEIDRLRGKKAK